MCNIGGWRGGRSAPPPPVFDSGRRGARGALRPDSPPPPPVFDSGRRGETMTRSGALLALAGLALLLAASCGSEPTEEPRPDSTAFEAALARRDSLRAVRAALRAEADSVEAESEALGAELEARPDFRDIESRIDAAIETLNLDGDAPPAAQIEALLPMLRSEIPDYADRFEALLFRIAEIDGEFDKLRESDVSADLLPLCAVHRMRAGEAVPVRRDRRGWDCQQCEGPGDGRIPPTGRADLGWARTRQWRGVSPRVVHRL